MTESRKIDPPPDTIPVTWLVPFTSAIRAAFGIIWAVNAFLTWRPSFADHFVGYFQNASQGQPAWLAPWFDFWLHLVTPAPDFFIWLVRILETLIAIGLLLGLARKWVYIVGGVLSWIIWATVEGFSGPYVAGVTNIGPALVYLLVFIALIMLSNVEGRTPYSLDYYIEQRWPWWRNVAEWASPRVLARVPPRLPWLEQGIAAVAIIAALAFLIGGLESAMNAQAATPSAAASAVSPLSLASGQVAQARDASLPPLLGNGDSVSIDLVSTDTTVTIASGVQYQAWTFGQEVPGPTFHVRQGQTVNVTFTNHSHGLHSIDFHAAQVPQNIAYRDVEPGQSIKFSFVANTPGAFLYHCGTTPVLLHIGNGMYGALIVDPATPLPPASASYVLVQGEWYTRQIQATVMGADFAKMQTATPDEVVFNGVAFQYRDHPLQARVGQRVRLYVVDAGPNLPSAFHVIGGMFDAVYPDGDPAHALSGVSTYSIAPGEGAVLDIIFPQAGQNTFVDHSMRDANMGAAGVINVAP